MNVNAQHAFLPIKYVGVRDTYEDGKFGTHIRFTKGESKLVPETIAKQMLKHPDVYIEGDILSAESSHIEAPAATNDEQERVQERLDLISRMPAELLVDMAKNEYGRKLSVDKRKNIDKETERLRFEVTQLIHQYGLV